MPPKPYYIYDLGAIYHGDCRDIIPDLPKVDLVLTDPPYFLPINSYVGTRESGYEKRLLGDMSILRTYYRDTITALENVMAVSGTYYVFCDAQSYPLFYEALFPVCKYVRLLIWDKIIAYNGYTWRHQHELIAWGEKGESPRIPTGDGDVLKCRGVLQADRYHPAEKPIELIKRLIGKHETSCVLDPFMGSGTTLVAAQALGRRSIGIEIEERYCEIAVKRLTAPILERGR